MATLTHLEPRIGESNLNQTDVLYLADAFTEFISASARLEVSYGTLQLEVEELSRQLAERNAALRSSQAENEKVHRSLELIVNSMPCGVLVVCVDGRVERMNPECCRLLELDPFPGQTLEAISRHTQIDFLGLLGNQATGEDEKEFCRHTQQGPQWLAVRSRRLTTADGQLTPEDQMVLIVRDTTFHKQAELERERARRATALSEVAATLAHEIRNPLASLELFAGLIAEGGPESSEWVAHLHAGIRSLSGTVNNVLSFHGAGFLPMTKIDLVDAIRSSVEFSRPIAEQAGVRLSFSSSFLELQMRANGSALQQIVLNLICNAVRHTAAGGSVEVTITYVTPNVDRTKNRVVLAFADTGSGIPEANLPEIFRAGFSGNGTSPGLGLAVCDQVVRQHDGSIQVRSELGRGTTFLVELPIL